MGMVMIVEGLPYFAFPARMKEMLYQLMHMDDKNLRPMGLSLMLGGLFLVYIGMKVL